MTFLKKITMKKMHLQRHVVPIAATLVFICGLIGFQLARQSQGFPPIPDEQTDVSGARRASDSLSNRPTLTSFDFDTVDKAHKLDRQGVVTLLKRQIPTGRFNLSQAIHFLQVFGAEATVRGQSDRRQRVLDLILNATEGDLYFNTTHMLNRTRFGARYALFDDFFLATNQANREAHPSQILAVCGSLGLPLNTLITFSDGTCGTLQDVLDDTVAYFMPKGDYLWDAISIVFYLPPAKMWTDRFGNKHSFDSLAEQVMDRNLESASCAGAHVFQTLIAILRADRRYNLLTDRVRTRLLVYLRQAVDALSAAQDAEGAWAPYWLTRMPGVKASRVAFVAGSTPRIIATGHSLEWLLLLPPEMRPPRRLIEKAARWLMAAQLTESADPQWLGRNYCPASHAVRVLAAMSGISPKSVLPAP